ncbi:hypothetical protein BDV24DRAFT_128523 [Aspergillus arachidicola]|uniref:Uncharacterized protein n=1 Tax=Aspergillus arachidicola TaxID=656916 RepID=A0A5N6YEC4_9EURO|nr:hypothetical protein BDV24DRAFT_128523 [Aspergillus arachidicola]
MRRCSTVGVSRRINGTLLIVLCLLFLSFPPSFSSLFPSWVTGTIIGGSILIEWEVPANVTEPIHGDGAVNGGDQSEHNTGF